MIHIDIYLENTEKYVKKKQGWYGLSLLTRAGNSISQTDIEKSRIPGMEGMPGCSWKHSDDVSQIHMILRSIRIRHIYRELAAGWRNTGKTAGKNQMVLT